MENNGTHTPGPWVESGLYDRDRDGQWTTTVENNYGATVAIVRGGDHPELAKHLGLANAHLIAAAPAMLEALEDCVESLSRLPDINGAYRVTCLQQARAAIAQAKGEGR